MIISVDDCTGVSRRLEVLQFAITDKNKTPVMDDVLYVDCVY